MTRFVLFDVGANWGTDSLERTQADQHVETWAFEPVPELIANLTDKSAEYTNRYHIVPSAVSDFDGTAQFNVSGGQIESVLIALPPLDAQRLMVDFLDARCAEIDALQRKTDQALESLYEFRMAIATSAVTGKIDVRGAA